MKALYYEKEYGDRVDFQKTFWENAKLGHHESVIWKQDTESVDTDTYLNGYVQEVMLQGGVQEVMLQGYVQNVMLQGYAQDVNYVTNLSNHAEIKTENDNANNGADFIINYALGTVVNSAKGDDTIRNAYGSNVTLDGGADNDSINNTAANVSINANTGDDFVENTRYTHWDYTKRKWMTSGTSPDNVSIFGGAGADSIYNYGGQNISINGGDGADRICNATKPCDLPDPVVYVDERPPGLDDDDYAEAGSSLGNGVIEDEDADNVYESAADVDTDTAPDNATLRGGAGDDSIDNFICREWTGRVITSPDNITVDGGAGDDTVTNEGENVLFVFSGGNDVIRGFNATSTLQIGDGSDTYSKATVGSDVVFTVDDNTVTLAGAATLDTLNILGKEQSSTTLTLTNGDAAKQTLASGVTEVDGSARTKATRIVGNALDNSILGGTSKDTLYGGKGDDYLAGGTGADKLCGQNGDDTLWGGSGNDTLIGGAGADTFIYTSGKDTITDYQSGELFQIMDSKFSKAAYSSGKLTLTIDGGGVVIFTNVTSSTEFNINGTTYHISGKTIK